MRNSNKNLELWMKYKFEYRYFYICIAIFHYLIGENALHTSFYIEDYYEFITVLPKSYFILSYFQIPYFQQFPHAVTGKSAILKENTLFYISF